MNTLSEIEAAAESLPPEQKEKLFRFLAEHLRKAEKPTRKAKLVQGPNDTLLLEAPQGAPPMTTETVKRLLGNIP